MPGIGAAGHQQRRQGEGGVRVGGRGGVRSLHRDPGGCVLGAVDGAAGMFEGRAAAGAGLRGQGLLDGPDADADAPVAPADEVEGEIDHDGRVGCDGLHLVAGGAFEGAEQLGAAQLAEQVRDPVDVPSAAALIDSQHEHSSRMEP
ncbi:hypothetical protein RHRU231_410041 [Rhodococcus ruber]|uniref:Uncharacterized protein n=1 Tax=Rhodococcus ruber TaxID=1830 RepID=A0A098BL50_9NOCA|nr:hypothetical protein RHRU231_410041 [Rhodococcus ruber]